MISVIATMQRQFRATNTIRNIDRVSDDIVYDNNDIDFVASVLDSMVGILLNVGVVNGFSVNVGHVIIIAYCSDVVDRLCVSIHWCFLCKIDGVGAIQREIDWLERENNNNKNKIIYYFNKGFII